MNFDGLHETIERLLAGQEQPVDTRTFSNDMVTFANKDDILTLLIHLGYLGYRYDKKTAYIPNKEIYDEYVASMKAKGLWKETIDTVLRSKQLLADTLAGKADVVADCIRMVHEQNSSVFNYNKARQDYMCFYHRRVNPRTLPLRRRGGSRHSASPCPGKTNTPARRRPRRCRDVRSPTHSTSLRGHAGTPARRATA